MPPEEVHWFLTVDWCKQGKRGLFTDQRGGGFWKEHGPHTKDEIYNILGPFEMILDPKSLPFTEGDMVGIVTWQSLGEYCDQYGFAVIPEDVLVTVESRAAALGQ